MKIIAQLRPVAPVSSTDTKPEPTVSTDLPFSIKLYAMPMAQGLKPSYYIKQEGDEFSHAWYLMDKDAPPDQLDLVAYLQIRKEDDGWRVAWSESNVRGYGSYLYELALKFVSARGSTLESDDEVSDSAAKVWNKYHQRQDVLKFPSKNVKTYPLPQGGQPRTEESLKYRYQLPAPKKTEPTI